MGGIPGDSLGAVEDGEVVVELAASGMVVVCDVVEAGELVAERIVEGGDDVVFVDEVGVGVAVAGQAMPCIAADFLGELAAGPIDFSEAEDEDMPPEVGERLVDGFCLNEDFRLIPRGEKGRRFVDPAAVVISINRGG